MSKSHEPLESCYQFRKKNTLAEVVWTKCKAASSMFQSLWGRGHRRIQSSRIQGEYCNRAGGKRDLRVGLQQPEQLQGSRHLAQIRWLS